MKYSTDNVYTWGKKGAILSDEVYDVTYFVIFHEISVPYFMKYHEIV